MFLDYIQDYEAVLANVLKQGWGITAFSANVVCLGSQHDPT